jgi:hypothetical protein
MVLSGRCVLKGYNYVLKLKEICLVECYLYSKEEIFETLDNRFACSFRFDSTNQTVKNRKKENKDGPKT